MEQMKEIEIKKYMSVLNDVKSKRYNDKTDFFEKLISLRYCTLSNCHGIGFSFLLKTLACFLDKNIDSRSFQMQICERM